MPPLFVLAQTTTTEVRRGGGRPPPPGGAGVGGDPPPTWVPVTAGLALLVAILVLGWIVNRRRQR
jgi:hypothetical protein